MKLVMVMASGLPTVKVMNYSLIRAIVPPPEGIVMCSNAIKIVCWSNGSSWITGQELDGQCSLNFP